MTNKEYMEYMIDTIIERQTRNQFTREELKKKSVRALETIYDNID